MKLWIRGDCVLEAFGDSQGEKLPAGEGLEGLGSQGEQEVSRGPSGEEDIDGKRWSGEVRR